MEQQKKAGAFLPLLAYFNICFFWGTTGVANKLGASALHPLMSGTIRFCTASLLILLWIAFRRIPLGLKKGEGKVLCLSSFLMYFLNTALLLFAAVRVDASISTIMLCLIPIVMVLMEALLSRRLDVSWIGGLGILGGFAGVAIVSAGGISTGGVDWLGLALLALSVLVWCTGTLYLKRHAVTAPFTTQILFQSLIPAGAFLLCALLFGKFHPEEVTWAGLLPAVYMGIADSIIGLSSYIYLLGVWKTSMVSTYAYINPVVGLILSAVILHETITSQNLIGAAVILLSVLLIQREVSLRALWNRRQKSASQKSASIK